MGPQITRSCKDIMENHIRKHKVQPGQNVPRKKNFVVPPPTVLGNSAPLMVENPADFAIVTMSYYTYLETVHGVRSLFQIKQPLKYKIDWKHEFPVFVCSIEIKNVFKVPITFRVSFEMR